MITPLALGLLLLGGGQGHPSGIRWEHDFQHAIDKARSAGKPVIVDFWADWCLWCHRLDKTTYVDPAVVKLSRDFVAVKVNTEGGEQEAAVALRYEVLTLPTIAFLSPSGRLLLKLNGFQGPGRFPRALEAAKEVAGRVMGWEAAIDRDPGDAEALAALGVHLFEQDAFTEAAEFLQRATRSDGKRPLDERKRTRLLLGAILKSDESFTTAEKVLKDGLSLPASSEYDAKLLYVLGKVYFAWGRPDDARVALTEVVERHGDTSIARRARETLVALDGGRARK